MIDFVLPPILDQEHLQSLTQDQRDRIFELDRSLHKLWGLGRFLIISWTPTVRGLRVLVIPHYVLGEMATAQEDETIYDPLSDTDGYTIVDHIISGPTMLDAEGLDQIGKYFGLELQEFGLSFSPGEDLSLDLIEAVVRRYSLSYVENGAVALFDIVGFSLYSALEQVTQLNSLAYSVNSAYSKMLAKNLDIQFARSTTGDGFYIWNRDRSIEANANLYHLMHLVLADNAIARSKGKHNTVPQLRACFHVGPHYEFFQSEGLKPTIYSYIVGDVTIELARMIDRALPGQILVGDFGVDMPTRESNEIRRMDAPEFIDCTRDAFSNLQGMELSGEDVDSIQCYLTGDKLRSGGFGIKRYLIKDKHGRTRNVFNAKVNIYRDGGDPIYLGFQTRELRGFHYEREEFISS